MMLLRETHSSKASSNTCYTESGMEIFEGNTSFKSVISNTCYRVWHVDAHERTATRKALTPILVTLSGISILLSEQQPRKAQSSIIVTLFGMITLLRELHFQKASFSITFAPSLIEYSPSKFWGALSSLFQSLLYFTPNSSSAAFNKSCRGSKVIPHAQVKIFEGGEKQTVGCSVVLKQRRVKRDGFEREGNGDQGKIVGRFAKVVYGAKGMGEVLSADRWGLTSFHCLSTNMSS